MFSLFGSCRIHKVGNNNYLNMELTFTHTTKEVIQFIEFLKGEKEMPPPYDRLCFRTPLDLRWNHGVQLTEAHKQKYNETKVFIVELCSRKKYIHNGYYLYCLSGEPKLRSDSIYVPEYVKNEIQIVKQTDKEIEDDIEEIQRLIHPHKLIIVSHYNAKLNGEYIPDRNNLINLLNKICSHKNIPFINPSEAMKDYRQEEVMTDDLGHYTELGMKIMTEYITKIGTEVLNNYLNQ
jgi:hypothetical protein